MMKKQIVSIVYIMILIFVCVGCTKTNRDITQIKDVPEVQLEYTVDGEICKVNVSSGTSSWSFDNGDGTFTGGEADAPHPLDSVGHMPEIKKVSNLTEMKISFSLTPDSYSVRRWKDNYIGNAQAYGNNFDVEEILEDTITLPNDEQGYIYEIHATWLQGNAYYTFYITNP